MKLAKKLFGVVMITLSLISIYPEKASAADGGAGYVLVAKEYGIDGIAWYVANRVIKKISAQTVNWINSGFKGNPAYVTNPEQFFLSIADDTASRFLSQNSFTNQLCSPFKAQVRLALVKNYLSEGNENFTCTLSKIRDNYDEFTQDFSVGGWDGWFEMTQNNQNNPYGAYLESQNRLAIEIGNRTNKYQKQLEQGSGFLSFEKCRDSDVVTASNIAQYTAEFGRPLEIGECLTEPETVTPGTVIEGQLNETLSGGLKRIEAADEIDEIIAALLDQLISKALGSAGGLFGASSPDSSGRTYTTDLLNDTSDTPPDRSEVECTTSPDGVDEFGNVIPGVTTCIQTLPPPVIPPVPPVPVVIVPPGGTGGGSCSTVTQSGALAILQRQQPTNAGINQALPELRAAYGSQVFLFTSPGDTALDKVNFGGGLTVDVIRSSNTSSATWSWSIITPCGGGGGGGGDGTTPASLRSDLEAERARYGTYITQAQAGAILNAVAWNNRSIGWGLSRKDGGNRCPMPSGGITVGCDILYHQPSQTVWDTFTSGSGTDFSTNNYEGRVTWSRVNSYDYSGRPWVAPVQP